MKKYQVIEVEIDKQNKYQVIDNKNWRWSEATNARGAVLGALACGVQLRDINFNGHKIGYIKQ